MMGIAREAMAARAPTYGGQIQCQFGKSKEWKKFHAQVGNATLELRNNPDPKSRPVRSCTLFSSTASAPKGARKGHAHCLRLDLAQPDTEGISKIVISVPDEKAKWRWLDCLQARHQASPDAGGMLHSLIVCSP